MFLIHSFSTVIYQGGDKTFLLDENWTFLRATASRINRFINILAFVKYVSSADNYVRTLGDMCLIINLSKLSVLNN